MIRTAKLGDRAAMMAVMESIALFPPEELAEMGEMLDGFLRGSAEPDQFWVVDDADGVCGVAFYAPERMTNGTWNLYFIGVDPRQQRRGHGEAMLRFVEETLRARGERILLVETSSTGVFENTRAFYDKCGYVEEARIREFYKSGDDKVIFWKKLAP